MKNGVISFLILAFILVLFYVHESSAVPPDPKVYPVWLPQNSIYQTPIETMESISRPPVDLTRGIQEVVVILVEFQNLSHSIIHDIPYFENLIFASSNPNSIFNYYKEVSYGQLIITGAVTGWYRSKENMEYYGKDGSKHDNFNNPIYELAREAIKLADSNGFDFSRYDNNHDGYIDHIIIVHSGRGQETGGGAYGPDAIWSHHWSIWPGEEVDGVIATDYSMVAEFSPMGTFAHEFGHGLGLPDLYDTDYSSQGVGAWCLMGYGSWQMGGDVPAHLCPWSKVLLGWVEPKVINDTKENLHLICSEKSNLETILKIPHNSQEYFLLENRRKIGFDQYLPGEGILIWHINDSAGKIELNNVNESENNKRVDLEEADGRDDLDKNKNSGDNTDPYYYPKEFTPYTVPNSKSYSGSDRRIKITNISSPGDIMSLSIHVSQNSIPRAIPGGPYLGGVGLPLAFDGSMSFDSDGDPLEYIWDFDDRDGIQEDSKDPNPQKIYNKIGIYNVTLIVSDGELRSQASTTAEIKAIQEMNLELASGWNLISLYLQPIDTRCESVLYSLGRKCEHVWAYNTESGIWQKFIVNGPRDKNDLTNMEAGVGYWILLNQPGILKLKGIQPGESIPLKAGWNLVGYNFNESIPIQGYQSSTENKVESIATYSSRDKKWLWYRSDQPDFLNSLKSIEPGKGYLINVKENSIWSPSYNVREKN